MIYKLTSFFLIISSFFSCNQKIYQYQSDSSTETIELRKGNIFNFTFENTNVKFNVDGSYSLKDSSTIEFIFNPIDKSNYRFLPINDAKVEFNQLNQEGKTFVYQLLIRESLIKEAVWGMEVNAFIDGRNVSSKKTDSQGKVDFRYDIPIDTFILSCEDCVPTIIKIEDKNSYSIDIIWSQVKGRYSTGHNIPDRGPIKLMKLGADNRGIIYIDQDDLTSKKFVRKKK